MKTLIIGKNSAINTAIGGLLKSDDYQNLNFIKLNDNLTKNDIENISLASLIIIDLTYTNSSSRLFVQQIRLLNPKAIILALHIYYEPEFINAIIQAGASAYLLLNTSSQEIETAIKQAKKGEIFISSRASK